MMKFESGYTVETVFDGSKLGIEPFSVEVSPTGELLVLDSVNSNIYRISPPLSRCELSAISIFQLRLFPLVKPSFFALTGKLIDPILLRLLWRKTPWRIWAGDVPINYFLVADSFESAP